ncbi:MAG: hypothetical protein ACI30J_07230 [Paludibacteraceae bacterium]
MRRILRDALRCDALRYIVVHRGWCVGLLCGVLFLCGCGRQPSKAEVRKAEKRQQDSLALVAQERTLAYYDSLQQALAPELDALLPRFKYEKDERYEDKGHYVHRLLRTTSNTARNYIQTYVRDDGQTIVRFFYYGERALGFEKVVLSAESLQDTFAGDVHAFEAEGWHETLTIEGDEALRCLHFVDAYREARVRVALCGSRSRAVYYLSQNDKDALMETYRLGMAMRDMVEVERRIKLTSIQVEKYQKRLEK